MNVDRLGAIRDYLIAPSTDREFGFNMAGWRTPQTAEYTDHLEQHDDHYCGTVCCIAGLACSLYPNASKIGGWETQAADILGLTSEQASRLFYGGKNVLEEITAEQAAHAITTLMETGHADWRDGVQW